MSLSNESASRQLWLTQAAVLQELLAGNANLARAFADPRVSAAKKEAVLLDVGKAGNFDNTLIRTLAILIRQGRGANLTAFLPSLAKRLKKDMGVVTANVTAAAPLSAAQEAALSKSLGDKVELNTSVDPSLLGGLVVQIGSWRMDDSVKGKLERLSRRLKSAA